MESWPGGAARSALAFFCLRTSLGPSKVCLFRRSANIAWTSKLNCLASCSRTCLTSETIGSSHIRLLSHQFLRRAYHWHVISLSFVDEPQQEGLGLDERPDSLRRLSRDKRFPCCDLISVILSQTALFLLPNAMRQPRGVWLHFTPARPDAIRQRGPDVLAVVNQGTRWGPRGIARTAGILPASVSGGTGRPPHCPAFGGAALALAISH